MTDRQSYVPAITETNDEPESDEDDLEMEINPSLKAVLQLSPALEEN